ncbi:hypothetical protein [Spongiivirga citrea]|uniref:Uncharacterized protein n=1 Tax=Spongiivirga citrea TaxID=1481457 RepID=A0A6M0CM31_9FLAO|nr:hypothetical protein [Spongiivirga citrea]NER16517.1 hypothetical protein [Spongiivirga citrea]
MNVHLLDLFRTQFTLEIVGKVRRGLGINGPDETVLDYCIKSASELINELPELYIDDKNKSLLQELVIEAPYVTTNNVFDDVDLRTSSILRNGKYLVHAIYGLEHLDFLKKIKEQYELSTDEAKNLWYISGSILLILIHSLTNKENSLTDLLSVIKREVEADKPKKSSSLFVGLLSL